MSEVWVVSARVGDASEWMVLGVSATREGAKVIAEENYEAPLERWTDLLGWSRAHGDLGITFDIDQWTVDA